MSDVDVDNCSNAIPGSVWRLPDRVPAPLRVLAGLQRRAPGGTTRRVPHLSSLCPGRGSSWPSCTMCVLVTTVRATVDVGVARGRGKAGTNLSVHACLPNSLAALDCLVFNRIIKKSGRSLRSHERSQCLCPRDLGPGINVGGWPDASNPDGCAANREAGYWQPWMD